MTPAPRPGSALFLCEGTSDRPQVAKRFPAHRRQLLERLDRSGPVTGLASFRTLVDDVEAAVRTVTADSG